MKYHAMPGDSTHWTFLWCTTALIGLIWSPAILSISMTLLLVTGVVGLRQKTLRRRAAERLRSQYGLWALTLLFWLVVPGFVGLDDPEYWHSRLRIKLPFLVLPLAFLLLPPLSRRQVRGLHLVLLGLLVGVSVQMVATYLLDYAAINQAIKEGRPMPTPGNHIRLSLLMAYGVVGGIQLLRGAPVTGYRREGWFVAGATFLVFLILHILSVRSGLVVLYAVLAAMLVHAILTQGHWRLGIGGLILLIGLPVLTYALVPSFRNKINYTRYQYQLRWDQNMQQGNYSDAGRILSWRIGWELLQEHPWLGVGPGNLRQRVDQIYAERYPEVERKRMPHNQFLSVAAGSGLLGLLVFLVGFLAPLFCRKAYRSPLLLFFYLIITLSCLVENTLENAEGVGLFTLWVCILTADGGRITDYGTVDGLR